MTDLDDWGVDWDDEDDEDCAYCGGEGYVHDCGEDTCCYADPDLTDLMACEHCHGTGR